MTHNTLITQVSAS